MLIHDIYLRVVAHITTQLYRYVFDSKWLYSQCYLAEMFLVSLQFFHV